MEAQEGMQRHKWQKYVYAAVSRASCFHEAAGSRKKTKSSQIPSLSFLVSLNIKWGQQCCGY